MDKNKFLLNLGKLYFEMDNGEKGLEMFQKIVEISPENPIAITDYAIMLSLQKRHEEAVKLFKKAVKIDKNYIKAYFNLGLSYFELKDLKNSERFFRKCLEKDPHSEWAQKAKTLIKKIEASNKQ